MATQAEIRALAQARRTRRSQLALAARLAASRAWKRLNPDRLVQSWDSGVGIQIVLATSALQLRAAQGADSYVAAVLRAQGFSAADVEGSVSADAFAGMASDGRTLGGLYFQALTSTLDNLSGGVDSKQAMESGLRQMQMMAETQVIDAGRVADGVATVNNRQSRKGGYVRVLTPPSCGRCAVLAGRIYHSREAFLRHPRCDCEHAPVGSQEAGNELKTDPKSYFDSLSAAQQDKAFTKAGAQAIRDGADISQVVNVRRRGAMYAAGEMGLRKDRFAFTTEGTTRFGLANRSARAAGKNLGKRLTPEAIYQLTSTPEEALRLLRRYGYIL